MSAPLITAINTFDTVAKEATYKITSALAINALNGTTPTPVENTVYKTGTQLIKLMGTFPTEAVWLSDGYKLAAKSGVLTRSLDSFVCSITSKEVQVLSTVDINAEGTEGYFEIQKGSGAPVCSLEFTMVNAPTPG